MSTAGPLKARSRAAEVDESASRGGSRSGPAARTHGLVSAGLLAAGAAVFMWGGGQHPPTDTSLGEIGTPEYFRAFAKHVVASDTWRSYHGALLAGPLLWALGAVGLPQATTRLRMPWGFGATGVVALAMGALAWGIVFVFDGFVAPLQAQTAVAGEFAPEAMRAFRSNQEVVARLGLVSWLLIGGGIAALAAGVLVAGRLGRLIRLVCGVSGVVIGLWPAFGWAVGIFRPSVFTDALWTPTAAATSLWFLLAAAVVVWGALMGDRREQPAT